MKKLNIKGKAFHYEQVSDPWDLCELKVVANAFKVVEDATGEDAWWIVLCGTEDPNEKGKYLLANEDGTTNGVHAKCIAFGVDEQDAKMIALSVNLAHRAANMKQDLAENISKLKDKLDKSLANQGYDLAKMDAKMNELRAQGKSAEEILEYMEAHRTDFLIKPDATKNKEEEWN